MADTQVDSGSDISAKVRTICTRRAPRGSAQIQRWPGFSWSLRRKFALICALVIGPGRCVCSETYIFLKELHFERCEASRHRSLGPNCAFPHCPENSRRGFFVYTTSWFLSWNHAHQVQIRTPTHRALGTALTLARTFRDSVNLFHVIQPLVPRCARGSSGRCRSVQYRRSESQWKWIFLWFRPCLIPLSAVGGTELLKASRNHTVVDVLAPNNRVCFVLVRHGPVVPLWASGESLVSRSPFARVCRYFSRPVSV